MQFRFRIWFRVIGLLVLVAVSHYVFNFFKLAFEHQRVSMRVHSYGSVLIDYTTLNLVNDQYDPSDQYSRSYEAWHTGNYAMADLNRKDPDGNPLYSWRFAEYLTWPVPLPHDQPWTAEEYRHTRDSVDLYPFCNEGDLNTFVFAMGGSDTAFDRNNRPLVKTLPKNLILFADVYQSNTHWMKPGDFNVETLPDKVNVPRGLGAAEYPGFLVCFVDGQIWRLKDETPVELVKRFCTITGARTSDRSLLEPYSLGVYQARREHLDWLPEEESPPEESETQTLTTGC
ncbi:MAG: hypothetical protein NXI29_27955 [bacterium]|nr:hypothetical protein [bacterium]